MTVSKDGRIFVNFPRSAEDAPISVVELTRDGQIKPYPGVEFAAYSIPLSSDGRTLYWKALTGRTLHRITTAALENPRLSQKDLEARVERVADTEPTDSLGSRADARGSFDHAPGTRHVNPRHYRRDAY